MLDWTKAFDRIDPTAMKTALLRFGLPEEMMDMIDAMEEPLDEVLLSSVVEAHGKKPVVRSLEWARSIPSFVL